MHGEKLSLNGYRVIVRDKTTTLCSFLTGAPVLVYLSQPERYTLGGIPGTK